MRRGINIRKKKKIIFNEINKKVITLLSLTLILLLLCVCIYIFFIRDMYIKTDLNKDTYSFLNLNENIPFSIKKIILFNNATADISTKNQLLNLDISQYCDIGIYLDEIKNENILISTLYIDNINISSTELGTPYLYKKTIPDLGKCSFSDDTMIHDRFDFNIINSNSQINYTNYELYQNGTTPISLGFYNKNVKTNFMSSNSEILYNGSLLKEAAIPLVSLYCNVSFTLNIITNFQEHYICNISFDIPFENDEGFSIYESGYITEELIGNQTNKFIRIK